MAICCCIICCFCTSICSCFAFWSTEGISELIPDSWSMLRSSREGSFEAMSSADTSGCAGAVFAAYGYGGAPGAPLSSTGRPTSKLFIIELSSTGIPF